MIKIAEIDKWIKENNLQDSYIGHNILYKCKLIPIRKLIGTAQNGDKIFLEETKNSYLNRYNKVSDHATSFILLRSDGITPLPVTQEYLLKTAISYQDEYNQNYVMSFLQKKNIRLSSLDDEPKKRHNIKMTEKEYRLVKEFLKKIRNYKEYGL